MASRRLFAFFIVLSLAFGVASAFMDNTDDFHQTRLWAFRARFFDQPRFLRAKVRGDDVGAMAAAPPLGSASAGTPPEVPVANPTPGTGCTRRKPSTITRNPQASMLGKRYPAFKPVCTLDTGFSPPVKTVGYGHMCSAAEGAGICASCKTTGAQIEEGAAALQLEQDLGEAEKCVRESISAGLTDNEYAALVAFARAISCATFKTSTAVTQINNNAYKAGGNAIRTWFTKAQKGTEVATFRDAIARVFEDNGCVDGGPTPTDIAQNPKSAKKIPSPKKVKPGKSNVEGAPPWYQYMPPWWAEPKDVKAMPDAPKGTGVESMPPGVQPQYNMYDSTS